MDLTQRIARKDIDLKFCNIVPGTPATGTYFGTPFAGTIYGERRNSLTLDEQIYVVFDQPITVQGEPTVSALIDSGLVAIGLCSIDGI